MQRWMMAGGAAVLISMGVARADEPASGGTGSAAREAPGDATTAPAAAAAPTSTKARSARVVPASGDGDRSGYVTHDELLRALDALTRQLDAEAAQRPAPQFTDEG